MRSAAPPSFAIDALRLAELQRQAATARGLSAMRLAMPMGEPVETILRDSARCTAKPARAAQTMHTRIRPWMVPSFQVLWRGQGAHSPRVADELNAVLAAGSRKGSALLHTTPG